MLTTPSAGLPAFAADLRDLSMHSRLDTQAVAKTTGLLEETIESLVAGDQLYSWEVTSAYLTACGDDPGAWWPRWKDLARVLNRPVWTRSDVTGPLPDPVSATTNAEFAAVMEELRKAVGTPSYNSLERRAAARQKHLPHATLHSAINGGRPLSADRVEAFAVACGLPDPEIRRWRAARARVGAPQPPASPVRRRWITVPRRAVPVIAGFAVLATIAIALYVIRLSMRYPVYVSLTPTTSLPSTSVDVSYQLPTTGDWVLEVRLSASNDDLYSDCVSRATVTYTVRSANGQILGQGEVSPHDMDPLEPMRLRQVDFLRLEASVRAPPQALRNAPDACARLRLDVHRIELRPAVPGWLTWLP